MSGNRSDSKVETAMKMNCFYATQYHRKFPYIARDEFISVGFVAIAKALKGWGKKKKAEKTNFNGYVKIALQNEYRRELNKTRIQRLIISNSSYSIIEKEEEDKDALETQETM